MTQAVSATVVFWSAFVFSAGPFWITIMEAAKDSSFSYLYKNYVLYLLFGWLPIIAVIGLAIGLLGRFHPDAITALHFVGAAVILHMAWKILKSKRKNAAKIDFNWKAMSLLSWTNPKVWLVIPTGFLSATYSDSLPLNITIFYLLGVPLFVFGVYMWGMIGRLGARIAYDKISYFNAALLCLFAGYLLYEGVVAVAGK